MNTRDILVPAPYVQLHAAEMMTGYSVKAMRRKIEEGHWLEGREYIKAPDGHILLSIKGYTQWAERGWESKSESGQSASPSPSTGRHASARSN
jgi:hypothetical protein